MGQLSDASIIYLHRKAIHFVPVPYPIPTRAIFSATDGVAVQINKNNSVLQKLRAISIRRIYINFL